MEVRDPLTTTAAVDPSPSLISHTTVLSLLCSLALFVGAVAFSHYTLPPSRTRRTLYLHTWHTFDFLIHTVFEGSFLYHCFFSYTHLPPRPSTSDYPHPASLLNGPPATWLGHADRAYGAKSSTSPTALLWQEYARADKRWAGADATVVSIEIFTVILAGPCAAYICSLLQRNRPSPSQKARAWFLMIILATGEIYGGFMTFAPEWLTGRRSLDTEDWMHLWVYLVFFNGLWVALPGWVLWCAWEEVRTVFQRAGSGGDRAIRKKRR